MPRLWRVTRVKPVSVSRAEQMGSWDDRREGFAPARGESVRFVEAQWRVEVERWAMNRFGLREHELHRGVDITPV